MQNFGEAVAFIWGVADLIRDTFRRGKYQDVILPFTVLRRIDCVLQPAKETVLQVNAQLQGKLENPHNALCRASGYAFYNTSPYDFDRLLRNAPNLAANLRTYISGFSANMREVLEKFDFDNTIAIRELNPQAGVYLYGQEVNAETFAVCKSDLYITSADGRDAENVLFGSVLSNDRHAGQAFDYLLANPPYGKDWKRDQDAVEAEARRGDVGRFEAGLPRISDGQLLFLQHMLAHMKSGAQGGSRVAVIMNGSPLFTGDAGQGESEIRRWILENDWLEAIVALPEQLFYNTGIATYIAVLSNHRSEERKGKVQLIDATDQWEPMRKSLGDKRRLISDAQIDGVTALYRSFAAGEKVKIFDTVDFGYRKITVERPLRLNFQANFERIAQLSEQKAFQDLATSKKKDAQQRAAEEEAGQEVQQVITSMLATLPATLFLDRAAFESALDAAATAARVKLGAPVRKAILAALSERDESAAICRDRDGAPEPDPELRDSENVPLAEDVHAYFAREVAPYVPDAWINTTVRDHKDKGIGKVGYEINFNRYFYTYQPPRPLEEIDVEIKALEGEILSMLRTVAG